MLQVFVGADGIVVLDNCAHENCMFNQNMARDVDALKLGKINVISSHLASVVKEVGISLRHFSRFGISAVIIINIDHTSRVRSIPVYAAEHLYKKFLFSLTRNHTASYV